MKVGRQILRNVTPICEKSQTCCLMGDPLWKTFWATIQRTNYSIWFIGWVSFHNCEGSVKNPSIWTESLTWIVPLIRSVRGRNLERWRTDRRPWGVGNDGRIGNLLEKTQCERGDISQARRICFSNRRWTNQTPGGEQDLRTSTSVWRRPIQREKVTLIFLENRKGLFHHNPEFGLQIHCSITIWYIKFFLCLDPWKIPATKAAVDQEWENRGKIRRGTKQKSEVRQRWSMKQERRALQFILHH